MLVGAVAGLMCLGFGFGCSCLMFALDAADMVWFIVVVGFFCVWLLWVVCL